MADCGCFDGFLFNRYAWQSLKYGFDFSIGFPLEKAISYSELRKPMLINDLKMQRVFR